MQTIFDTYKKTGVLHHAYLISDTTGDEMSRLKTLISRELGITTSLNPDFWVGEFDTFGIDDSRAIKELQSLRPFAGERKIFVLCAHFFTREAQNSLLKVFEEPTANTHFFIITSNTESLLPTLKSRLFLVTPHQHQESGLSDEAFSAADFLKRSRAKRLELLKDMIESKDKNRAILFLNTLEHTLYQESAKSGPMTKDMQETFTEIGICRNYLNDRSPSTKMILEHMALTVPSKER
ncbi:MAG: hypothetical protein NUV49_01980 [Patescibacteria group bacterium]|nr:hypothetical protein [Patescibacteria group bacterium]